MNEVKPDELSPVLGADLTLLDGTVIRVHQECKKIRDDFSRWLVKQALDKIDEMIADQIFPPSERATRRQGIYDAVSMLKFSYGSDAWYSASISDEGTKQLLWLRCLIAMPTLPRAAIEAWVDKYTWGEAAKLCKMADGFVPKSEASAGQS